MVAGLLWQGGSSVLAGVAGASKCDVWLKELYLQVWGKGCGRGQQQHLLPVRWIQEP